MHLNPEYENADSSIRVSFKLFSNRIDSSDAHDAKHDLKRISTDDGIATDFNPD
jgi:hypothetical protein